jgi:hypothetical protein
VREALDRRCRRFFTGHPIVQIVMGHAACCAEVFAAPISISAGRFCNLL